MLYHRQRHEYILAEGRRNCGESRRSAALRELAEETGFSCQLLPLTMPTRAPPAIEIEQLDDEPRTFTGISEPFALQMRRLGQDDLKLIWWYVAAIDENKPPNAHLQEAENYQVEFCNYTEVLKRLTFQMDRDMVERAIDLVVTRENGETAGVASASAKVPQLL